MVANLVAWWVTTSDYYLLHILVIRFVVRVNGYVEVEVAGRGRREGDVLMA